MTYDMPQPAPRQQPTPAPRFDVDMSQRQDGRQNFRQNGNLDQRANLDQRSNLDQRANQEQNQQGTFRQDGQVRQDVNGRVQQNVDGNTLRTGDVRSTNQAGGASIDNHSTTNNNRTDKSVNVGSQFLPECTFGFSVGVPGSGALQIGVPSKECMVARGKAIETQASAQVDIAKANSEAEIARSNADRDVNIANINASERLSAQRTGLSHTESMTKMACEFSVNRAGTAREGWQQFDSVSS